MSDRIRVLGIAPYENMKELMISLAQEYPQIDLTMFVGDRERGLEIARENFHGNYDVIISRGGTAEMLKRSQALPVIEIEISTYDLLYSLRLAGGLDRRAAVICADNIADSARKILELMDLNIEIHIYDTKTTAEDIIGNLDKGQYDVLLCDMVAYTMAKTRGLNAFLVMSRAENVRRAFEQAVQLCHGQSRLRDENLFLRELLHWQIGYTTILDENGSLYLSTMKELTPELLELLRRELPESRLAPERRIIRSLNGVLHIIRSRRIYIGQVAYTAFFYDIRRTPMGSNHIGMRSFSRPEVEDRYCRGVFSTSGFAADAQAKLDIVSQSAAPVMIVGEDGAGKESAVDILYLRSPLRNNPQIHVNCAVLGEKEWDFLYEHHNSPLADEGSTLYFLNADTISPEKCRRLISVLTEMRVCSRNRVFFSCVCRKGEAMPALANEIVNDLCCLTVELPSLRELSARIPVMINMYLNRIHEEVPHQLLGAEPQAVELLQQFHWPHNFVQFRRVLNELTVSAQGQYITAEAVRNLLRRERHVGSFIPGAENADIPLDLTRPLEEINRDIVRRVVEDTGGNHTAAAKRLGISRTTLWRMVQTGERQ